MDAPGFAIDRTTVGDDSKHAPDAVGISPANRGELRRVIMRAAKLGVAEHARMTYTEGPLRWSGITHECRSILGEVPPDSDCSAFATWCYWDASRWLKLPDIVNGDNWLAGYTGTMVQHGVEIPLADAQQGDLVFYGEGIPFHVAIFAGRSALFDGGAQVVSMGRPGAPELVGVGKPSQVRKYI